MKFTALFFALLVAGIAAEPVRVMESPESVPQARISRESILVTIIRSLIQTAIDYLAGSDPLRIEKFEVGTSIVDGDIALRFSFDSMNIEGFSDIAMNHIDYVGEVLTLDLEFRQISFSLKNLDAFIGPIDLKGDIGLTLKGTALNIEAELDIGSITLRSIDITPRIGSASSEVKLFFIGDDISDFVSGYVLRLRDWLVRAAPRIAEILEIIIINILN